MLYDFTTSSSKAYGNLLADLGSGVYGLNSGDVNQDGEINNLDYNQVEREIQLFTTGYVPTDLDGNWILESSDFSFIENKAQLFLFTLHP